MQLTFHLIGMLENQFFVRLVNSCRLLYIAVTNLSPHYILIRHRLFSELCRQTKTIPKQFQLGLMIIINRSLWWTHVGKKLIDAWADHCERANFVSMRLTLSLKLEAVNYSANAYVRCVCSRWIASATESLGWTKNFMVIYSILELC